MEKDSNNQIEVKAEYISIDFTRRVLTAVTTWGISFLLIIIGLFYLALQFSPNLPIDFVVIPAGILSAVVSILPMLSQRILKNKTKKWTFKDFEKLDINVNLVYMVTFLILILYVFANFYLANNVIWESISLFIGLLAATALLILLVSSSFQGFYTLKAKTTLSFLKFLRDYGKDSNLADFSLLLFASKNVNKIVKDSNMEIDPYKLCLGLSIGCIQNKQETLIDILDFSKWAQDPRNDHNFRKFRQAIFKYNNLSLDASDCGITEKEHWSFERKSTVLGVLIVPFAVSLIAVLLPKLIELIG